MRHLLQRPTNGPTRHKVNSPLAAVWQAFLQLCVVPAISMAGDLPASLRPWMVDQQWRRDVSGPIITLGEPGAFDDTHIFAPAVARMDGAFSLWYCGARGTVQQRVFRLGLATSENGLKFAKRDGAVFGLEDGKHSILTPALLCDAHGAPLRDDGKLRMWFSSTCFEDKSGLHTLHESVSLDGITWRPPSPALLRDVYAPTVIKTDESYRMWFTDVSGEPWVIKHARSSDGMRWQVTQEPVLCIDQQWESKRLFYPTVLQIENGYAMWYGSYWSERDHSTALGFAVSLDGLQWYKHPGNPVFRPDPARDWESNYVTSQSVMRLPDGRFRIWYASRKRPPFVNKYFAINTAVWQPPEGIRQTTSCEEQRRKIQ